MHFDVRSIFSFFSFCGNFLHINNFLYIVFVKKVKVEQKKRGGGRQFELCLYCINNNKKNYHGMKVHTITIIKIVIEWKFYKDFVMHLFYKSVMLKIKIFVTCTLFFTLSCDLMDFYFWLLTSMIIFL